ncbi:MAG: hypothetical protein IJ083_14150 [Clostridia bacterium]|nr:hypothetical protein [Clostridia bacterium]
MLVSIIPGFVPQNDPELLEKAKASRPKLNKMQLAPLRYLSGDTWEAAEGLKEKELGLGDQVTLDFGRHAVGHVSLDFGIRGSHQDAPLWVRLEMAERLEELEERWDTYRGWISPSWLQREEYHLDSLPCTLSPERRFAFRYVRITVLGVSRKFRVTVNKAEAIAQSAADWDRVPERRFFEKDLQRIYDASLMTLSECTQDVMEDGPKRDRRLWLGDLKLQAETSYISFQSLSVIRRCLYLFAGSRFPDGRLSANVFTDPEIAGDDTYLMDYALFFLDVLCDYVEHAGDREALNDLHETALFQMEYVLERCQNGLISPESAGDFFIDWSDDLDKWAAAQGIVILALNAAERLCGLLGDTERAGDCRKKAEEFRRAARAEFYDPEKGLCLSRGQVSLHTQVFLTLSGVMTPEEGILAIRKAEEVPGSPGMMTPYMHHYYLLALLMAGEKDAALHHMRLYWGSMLEGGADTFFEAWDPEDPTSSPYGGSQVNSYCHAWSCTPARILVEYYPEQYLEMPVEKTQEADT